MDYSKTGIQVFHAVGGNQNIKQMTHCATRMRFILKDFAKADKAKIKAISGVLDVVQKGGQLQVIIGPDVSVAFRAAETLYSGGTTGGDAPAQGNILNRIMAVVVGIFNPMLPAITGAGMIKAVLAILKAANLIDTGGQVFAILTFISDAAFYFMPMILAYSSAKVFKCSPGLAITLAGVLLHPSFAAMKAAGDPVSFLGLPVTLVGYSGTVIPIIMIVFIMAYVEHFAERVLPTYIKYIGKPLIVMLVMAPLSLIVIGPLGSIVGNLLAAGVAFLDNNVSWLVPTLIGTFTPLLVMFGLHNGLFPIATTQLGALQYESVMGPGMLPSNVAQGAACMAVAIKTKSKEMRQQAISAGVTALLGITEPAMYGVTLRLKTPLIAVMVGGGLGGLYAGITGVVRYSFGSPGFATLPVFIGENPANFRNAVISMIIGIVVTFAVAMVLKFDENLGSEEGGSQAPAKQTQAATVQSPVTGSVVALQDVPDEVFSKGILGKGVAVQPTVGSVVAPFDCTVTIVDTKHAVCFENEQGVSLLVHVGIDTVELDGKHFTAKVENGTRVKQGTLVLEFDMDAIQKAGFQTITPVTVSNSNEFAAVQPTGAKQVKQGETLLTATV